jgi:hypothetical protein
MSPTMVSDNAYLIKDIMEQGLKSQVKNFTDKRFGGSEYYQIPIKN